MKKPPKLIALIKRKSGISLQDFIHHYENNHAPLVASLLPYSATYVRNYVFEDAQIQPLPAMGGDYDVVTEVTFASLQDFEAFKEGAARPDVIEKIQQDERNFLEQDKTRLLIVQPY
ncbi:conserved hypothetical protein [Sphingobium faniae]|nr:conserved hypothetical protein [Sphingobium faniae]